MRKLKITIIVLLSAAALCMCVLLGIALYARDRAGFENWNSEGGEISADRRNDTMVQEWEFPAEDIHSLRIDMSFQDVIFRQGTKDTVVVREYMNFEPEDRQRSRVVKEDGELLIKGGKFNSFHFFFNFSFFGVGGRDAYVEICLPEGSADRLDMLHAQTSSGDIRAEISFTGQKDFSVSSTSGDIVLRQMEGDGAVSTTSGDVMVEQTDGRMTFSTTSGYVTIGQAQGVTSVSTTSGDIRLKQAQGDVTISSTSGEIMLEQAESDVILSSTSGDVSMGEIKGRSDITTTSGEVYLKRLDGTFRMETTSGDISISGGNACGSANAISGEVTVCLENLTGDLMVSTSSGDVELRLPGQGSYRLDFTSSSGECSTFFDDVLSFDKRGHKAKGQYGDGANAIEVSTTSGDLGISAW